MTVRPHAPPRISIVIPSFRAAATIDRALGSLVGQDYPDLQIIVIDGASDDGTADVIRRYEAHIDFWVSEPDKCQAEALNKGFARADGALFGWLCADDALLPGALARMSDFFQAHPEFDGVTGGCVRDFGNGNTEVTVPPENFYERLDYANTFEQPSTLWRAGAHARAGELDESFRYAFDWEWWCRLKRAGARFGRLEEPLSRYHFSDGNLTSSGGRKIADEMYRVVKAYGPYGGRLADVYRFLYRAFDLRGYYDRDNAASIPEWRRRVFHLILGALYRLFDRERISAYNWHFAARQERGLGWE